MLVLCYRQGEPTLAAAVWFRLPGDALSSHPLESSHAVADVPQAIVIAVTDRRKPVLGPDDLQIRRNIVFCRGRTARYASIY